MSADEHLELTQHEDSPADVPAWTFRRIPNLGHALLFFTWTGLTLLTSLLVVYLMFGRGSGPPGAQAIPHPKTQLAAMAITYALSLLAAWFVFPLLWHRTFLDGIRWNVCAAKRHAWKLIPLGLLLSAMAQTVSHFISVPKTPMLDDFFLTPADAWLLTAFGSVLAPLFEEIAFRGFLLPAFAIANDWLVLDRTPEARLRWQSTSTLSPAGLAISAIVSSVLFALLHGAQVGHAGGVLMVLFGVSLVFTLVRIRTQSVAASTVVHGSYNFFVFLIVMMKTSGFRHMERLMK
jgi:membrane protease YdiL (CAAX protease family)